MIYLLIADIKLGSIKNVVEYGEPKLQRPLPNVVVIPENGPSDSFTFQIWVHMAVGHARVLDRYVKKELPMLLHIRKNSTRQNVWKFSNNYDGIVTVQDQINYLRAGIVVSIPKIVHGFSASV